MSVLHKPSFENNFLSAQAELLANSYRRLTGKDLLCGESTDKDISQALFEASFGLVSHNTDPDPIFNYGNETALTAFEMEWPEFIQLASRDSAEAVNRTERDLLMSKVKRDGFVDNYRGMRISKSGRRFLIERATIWNVIDALGDYRGQAAVFYLGA